MIVRNSKDEFDGVRCDKCPRIAPPVSDIIINRGLVNMGWKCSGGSHLCPDCARK